MGREVFKPTQIGARGSSRPRTCSPDPTLIFGLWEYDPLVWSFSSKVENLSPWSHISPNSFTLGTSFWVHRVTTKHLGLGLSKISISGGLWFVFCTLGSLYHNSQVLSVISKQRWDLPLHQPVLFNKNLSSGCNLCHLISVCIRFASPPVMGEWS